MIDPLFQYHTMLRSGRPSGYPNMSFMAPHPYQMAYSGVFQPTPVMASYSYGRDMRDGGDSPVRSWEQGQPMQSFTRNVKGRKPRRAIQYPRPHFRPTFLR